MKPNLHHNKKAITPVVATVLLIAVTVIAITIVITYIIPFINNQLDNSNCFEIQNNIQFAPSKFNCHDTLTTGEQATGFSIKTTGNGVQGAKLTFTDQNDNSITHTITNGINHNTIKGVEAPGFDNPLSFPTNGGQHTYAILTWYEKIDIAPITTDQTTCAITDTLTITQTCTETGAQLEP